MADDRASMVAPERSAVSEELPPPAVITSSIEPATDGSDEPALVDATGAASRRPAWADEAVDALLVAILALASLAAAWSGYQAARWSGVQASSYTQASARRIESTRASTFAHQQTIVDVMTFTNYVNAWLDGDAELADFYEQRFRAELRPAFDAWMATNPLENPDAPPSPFVMPEYALASLAQADELEAEAADLFNTGADANQQSDDYVLNTVVLATVLFFAGVAPRVRWLPAQLALVTLALALFAYGLINVATYPIE